MSKFSTLPSCFYKHNDKITGANLPNSNESNSESDESESAVTVPMPSLSSDLDTNYDNSRVLKPYWQAPMVGQSDCAFRLLIRLHKCDVTYTEMFYADKFRKSKSYRNRVLWSQIMIQKSTSEMNCIDSQYDINTEYLLKSLSQAQSWRRSLLKEQLDDKISLESAESAHSESEDPSQICQNYQTDDLIASLQNTVSKLSRLDKELSDTNSEIQTNNITPLVVQFAANNSKDLIWAAKHLIGKSNTTNSNTKFNHYISAIELNLGCPQRRARIGNYGAWLCSTFEGRQKVVQEIVKQYYDYRDRQISKAYYCQVLPILFCKIRLLPQQAQAYQQQQIENNNDYDSNFNPGTNDRRIISNANSNTIGFCQDLRAAGCPLISIHGRYLEMDAGRGNRRRRQPAKLDLIKDVNHHIRSQSTFDSESESNSSEKSELPPLIKSTNLSLNFNQNFNEFHLITNGNVRCGQDILDNLAYTGCDAAMVGETILENPAIFEETEKVKLTDGDSELIPVNKDQQQEQLLVPISGELKPVKFQLSLEYLDIVIILLILRLGSSSSDQNQCQFILTPLDVIIQHLRNMGMLQAIRREMDLRQRIENLVVEMEQAEESYLRKCEERERQEIEQYESDSESDSDLNDNLMAQEPESESSPESECLSSQIMIDYDNNDINLNHDHRQVSLQLVLKLRELVAETTNRWLTGKHSSRAGMIEKSLWGG